MSGKSSRNKGSAAEREVAAIFNEKLGLDIVRTPHSGAGDIKGDIMNRHKSSSKFTDAFNRYLPEIKRQERIRIMEWFDQAQSQCLWDEAPLVIFRQNRKPWMITMTLDDWIEMFRMAYGTS